MKVVGKWRKYFQLKADFYTAHVGTLNMHPWVKFFHNFGLLQGQFSETCKYIENCCFYVVVFLGGIENKTTVCYSFLQPL